MGKFWHSFGHVIAHVGLGALQVANVSWFALPPPFNLAVAGGAAAASVIIASTHKGNPGTPVPAPSVPGQ